MHSSSLCVFILATSTSMAQNSSDIISHCCHAVTPSKNASWTVNYGLNTTWPYEIVKNNTGRHVGANTDEKAFNIEDRTLFFKLGYSLRRPNLRPQVYAPASQCKNDSPITSKEHKVISMQRSCSYLSLHMLTRPPYLVRKTECNLLLTNKKYERRQKNTLFRDNCILIASRSSQRW